MQGSASEDGGVLDEWTVLLSCMPVSQLGTLDEAWFEILQGLFTWAVQAEIPTSSAWLYYGIPNWP